MDTIEDLVDDPRFAQLPIDQQLFSVDQFTFETVGAGNSPEQRLSLVENTNNVKRHVIDTFLEQRSQPEVATPSEEIFPFITEEDEAGGELSFRRNPRFEAEASNDDLRRVLIDEHLHDATFTTIANPLAIGQGSDLLAVRRTPTIDRSSRLFEVVLPSGRTAGFEFDGKGGNKEFFNKVVQAVTPLVPTENLSEEEQSGFNAIMEARDEVDDGFIDSAVSDLVRGVVQAVARFETGFGTLTGNEGLVNRGEQLKADFKPIATDSLGRAVAQSAITEIASLGAAGKATQGLNAVARVNAIAAIQTLPRAGDIFRESFADLTAQGVEEDEARGRALTEATGRSVLSFALERAVGKALFTQGGAFNSAASKIITEKTFRSLTPRVQKLVAGVASEGTTESFQTVVDAAAEDISRTPDKFADVISDAAAVFTEGKPIKDSELLFSTLVGGVTGGAAGTVVATDAAQSDTARQLFDKTTRRIRSLTGRATPADAPSPAAPDAQQVEPSEPETPDAAELEAEEAASAVAEATASSDLEENAAAAPGTPAAQAVEAGADRADTLMRERAAITDRVNRGELDPAEAADQIADLEDSFTAQGVETTAASPQAQAQRIADQITPDKTVSQPAVQSAQSAPQQEVVQIQSTDGASPQNFGPGAMNALQPLNQRPTPDDITGSNDGDVVLKNARRTLTPAEKVSSVVAGFAGAVKGARNRIETGFVNKFRPIDILEKNITAEAGVGKPEVKLSKKFEQIPGASGKAANQIKQLDRQVLRDLKDQKLEDLNAYMFLRRSFDRLADDPKRKKVGTLTIEQTKAGLDALKAEVGPEGFQRIEDAAEDFQAAQYNSLMLQVQSGRLSLDAFNAIRESSDFYAPFKVTKHYENIELRDGTANNIATAAPLTREIVGISDDDTKISNPYEAGREQMLRSRMLADKNMKMQALAALADIDPSGTFVKKIKEGQDPGEGFDSVPYFENGVKKRLAVPPDVARALRGMNATQSGLVMKTARRAAALFRAGATTANLAFQPVNLFFADQPRLAIESKYGVRKPQDLYRFPLDFIHSMYSSFTGNFSNGNQLYRDFLDSGAANSTIQQEIRGADVRVPTLFKSRSGRAVHRIIRTPGDMANAIEETTKLMGLKRGLRAEGFKSVAEAQRAGRLDAIAAEVRNFAGSPDFFRRGEKTAEWNLIFMFMNARIQGTVATLGRLAGASGTKDAALAWSRLSAVVGVPTAALMLHNQRQEYKDDYEKLSENERNNYFMIPRDSYFTNEQGERVRDYWRIPKRETIKLFANTIESSLRFAEDKDPEGLADFATDTLVNLTPINVEGDNIQERMESVVSGTNPLIKVPVEIATGRNTWLHRDVVPERVAMRSPENQYYDSTNESFKAAAQSLPDWFPDFLRSPLQLENTVKGLTAGLLTQVIVKKPLEGREGVTEWPVFKRFFRSRHVDRADFYEAANEALRDQADKQFQLGLKAEELNIKSKTLEPQDRLKLMSETRKASKQLFDKWKAVRESEDRGLDASHRMMLRLQTNNGARAKFIADRLRRIDDPVKRNEYASELSSVRVITKEVRSQLRKIFREDPIKGGVTIR